MSNFAWVTLATNDSYSLGALVVANSLKQAATEHQLAVLITPGVTEPMRQKLSAAFNVVQEVNVLDSKDVANLALLARPELGVTFTKLHCWRLTQFEKCVFLDADTLILQNCDELFDREELSAAPDVGWPDCFNSGVFVYRPSLDQFAKLMAFAVKQGSFDGGDQGLLNLYFSDWATKDIARRLPFVYNTCSTACYSYLPAFKQFGQDVKILHFIGQLKPWLVNFDTATRTASTPDGYGHLTKYLQLWWDIFCNDIHPKLSLDMGGLAGALAQLTLGKARTSEQQVYEESMRQQCWESGHIDYLGTTNKLIRKNANSVETLKSRNVVAAATSERRSSITTTSSVQKQQSTTTSSLSTEKQQKQSVDESTTSKTSAKQQKTAKSTASKKTSTEKTQQSGIDVNQPIVIVPGHQKVEFDSTTNTKIVTEKTTTGYQQTFTTVSDTGLTSTKVKTFFDPVEIAGEETIEEEEETYEEVIETTEPTTRTTSTKTTTGASDNVMQHLDEQKKNSTTTTSTKDQTQIVSARQLPESTVTTRQIGEEDVRYETVVSEDGKTTTTRKIVTTPGEETEIVEYEELEVTEPREIKVVTTTKVIPTLANIRSERNYSHSVEEVEEQTSSTTTTKKSSTKVSEEQQKKDVKVKGHVVKKVSDDGRQVETNEYEERHITEQAKKPQTKTSTTVFDVKKNSKNTEETNKTNIAKTTQNQQQQLVERSDNTDVAVTAILPDGQEVLMETSLSADGRTKLLTRTVRQPEEDEEIEDYEETSTTVPRKRTTKSNNAVVSVEQTDDERLNTIRTDKTRTRTNQMASESLLVDAATDRSIGKHQQVANSRETSKVTGLATTSVDADRGSVTANVQASETKTKELNQQEVTVMGNETKTSQKSESHTESRTITSTQTSSGLKTGRQQRDSLTDTNLAAIKQKQQSLASSTTTEVAEAVTEATNARKMIQQQQQQHDQKQVQNSAVRKSAEQTDRSKTTTSTKQTTTSNQSTVQQQQQQQQKSAMEGQLKLSSTDKKYTSEIVSNVTDPKTGEVTTEEVRYFDGGREHIFTTLRKDGTMKMSSKTFFDAVPVDGVPEVEEEDADGNTDELAKKKLQCAVSSKQTANSGDVRQPIPPPRKKEVVKQMSHTKNE